MLYPAELKAHFSKSPAGSFTGVTKPPASFRIRARLSLDSDPAGDLYLPAALPAQVYSRELFTSHFISGLNSTAGNDLEAIFHE